MYFSPYTYITVEVGGKIQRFLKNMSDGITFVQAADQDYEKEKLNERIAKLSGGVAVIQVI